MGEKLRKRMRNTNITRKFTENLSYFVGLSSGAWPNTNRGVYFIQINGNYYGFADLCIEASDKTESMHFI